MSLDQGPGWSTSGRGRPCSEKPAFMRSLVQPSRDLETNFCFFPGSLFPPQVAVCCVTVGWTCVHSRWLILISGSLILTFFIIFYTDRTLCFSEPFLYVVFYLILLLTLLNR